MSLFRILCDLVTFKLLRSIGRVEMTADRLREFSRETE